jgi:transcription antitermination factor NusG
MEHKYDIVAIFCAILLLLSYIILIIYLIRKRNNINVFDLIESNRLNSSFREEVNLIFTPNIGEKVQILSSPWKGLCGYVTKYNEDSTYNIKVTRTLNPFDNHIPRNVIIKKDDEILLIE